MRWQFPEVGPFCITDKDGTWTDCRLIAQDEETVTFDYTAANNGARMRCQLLSERIACITYPTPVGDEAERFMNDR